MMDLTSIKNDVAAIIAENSTSIVIRRGSGTLAAQTVRVERRDAGTSARRLESFSEEQITVVLVLGSTTLDIQKDDRFTYQGNLYRVLSVRPNRQVSIQAEAIMIE